MNILLQKVCDFLEEARVKHNISKADLEKNGSVIYANGNDGTDFDWEANGRLCEFGYGVKDGSVWAFKLLLDNGGMGNIYCYPHGEQSPIDTLTKQIMTSDEALELKNLMQENADCNRLWDCTLEEIFSDGTKQNVNEIIKQIKVNNMRFKGKDIIFDDDMNYHHRCHRKWFLQYLAVQ